VRRFQFKLQGVLTVREYTLEQAKARLAEKSGACAILELRLEENAGLTLDAARTRFRKGGSTSDFQAGERYARRLEQERERLMKALAMAEAERERARAAYVEASKAKELIQKLKERSEAEYYKTARLEEFKALDDMAAMARARASVN